MIDVWLCDDFFHNGAFRQSYGYDYVLGLESTNERSEVSYEMARAVSPWMDTTLSRRGNFDQAVKKSGSRCCRPGSCFSKHSCV